MLEVPEHFTREGVREKIEKIGRHYIGKTKRKL